MSLEQLAQRDWETLPERITRRLSQTDNGCWNWVGPHSLNGKGRGMVSVGGKPMLHHRAIWTLLRGPIPAGAMLCHHCDNQRCGNPAHLYVGDAKTNAADMFNRGRHWTQTDPERAREVGTKSGKANTWHRGEGNPRVKLTAEQVEEIRRSTGSSRSVAAAYGVNATTIQRIRNGSLWNS